jgi:hypothetical protein
MKPDITSLLAELLFLHPSVTIPGLGTFLRSYQEAQIQSVHRQALPPSAQVHFDEGQQADDGLLQDELCLRHGMEAGAARAHIREFAEATKAALARRESVLIPRMGRLFLDFEQRCRFSPENLENLNIDAYGLPPVSLPAPLARTQVSAPETSKVPEPTPVAKESSLQAWLHSSMPWVLLLSLGILVVTVYFISRESGYNLFSTQGQVKETPPERTNTRPMPAEPDEDAEQENLPPEFPDDEEELDTEAPTMAPGTKLGIIIIGSFKDEVNAKKLIQDLFRDGYEAYSDQKGSATRVGIQFGYSERSEVQAYLKDIREKYNAKAWVMEAN